MNILIIGGTGVLSSAVANEALKQGIKVTMINRGNNIHLIPDSVEFIKSDKNDFERIRHSLKNKKFDAVMDYLCYSDKEIADSFNFYSSYAEQYFFISSCAVYNTSLGNVCSEDSPKVLPIWDYSVNKWASEEYLKKLAEQSEANYTIIRPCVTYGDTRIPYGISPQYGYHWTLISRILNGKPIIRWNGGINRCNMMRVEDFAVGAVALVGNPKAYNEEFNICGDEAPSFNDVLDVLSDLIGKKVKVVDITSEFYAKELPSRAGEILGGRSIDSFNSNDKIKRLVPSFCQTIPLAKGIEMTYNAYIENNYQFGIDWKFEGDTDRIVKKWCRKKDINIEELNLSFIDYLNNATTSDKREYYWALHRKRWDIRILLLGSKVIRKIRRIVCKK
ncbi:NAD-dependent epimerase/dehydratase family protein [Bacteroides fluxus]|uniref:NAD-dependent epimerase/dehydratase family protein n=1 Tax=Bacteroides fluxus TaxID=626930 RepID=UPI0023563E75|nr:NAD-dependent epimerase/dehydratase family protein [Bacteroides fluxus]